MTLLDKDQIDSLLRSEKERLSELPYLASVPDDLDQGVLLSDRIEHYCRPDSKLISPFCKSFLRPAGYDLRVGNNYAVDGKHYTLNDGGELTIEPYQVAVIQTLETLNLPDFLIGRWNIRVGLAYRGLLWVGGAQVDPGFRGRLSCPIYNLSTIPVTLKHGEELAMIDFVVTTTVKSSSIPFQWWRKKLVFQQYNIALQSGVAHRLESMDEKIDQAGRSTSERLRVALEGTSQKFESIQSRIDSFMTLAFTVVAILFAGLGIVATKGSDDPSFVSSPVWVAAVALYFAYRPYVIALNQRRADQNLVAHGEKAAAKESSGSTNLGQDGSTSKWYVTLLPSSLELIIASIVVISSLGFHIWGAHVSAREVRQAKEQASQAMRALDREERKVEMETQLRQRTDARLESLQQQITIVLQNQVTKK